MTKGEFHYGVAMFCALLCADVQAEAGVAVNIEEHRDSVAPLIERNNIERNKLGRGSVARAVFTKQVVNREPVDDLTRLSTDVQGVYFFTELKNMAGHTATHRWEYDGQRVGQIEFNVTAAHWRAWSYRKIPPGSTGTWKVKVLNTVGEVVGEKTLAP